jgi:lysophospholipase L1-like esterase
LLAVSSRLAWAELFLGLIFVFGFMASACADTLKIVALGASSTAGYGGIPPDKAFPGLIEKELRATGCDVRVTVDAVSGRTSADLVRRVSAVPKGTHLVLIQGGASFDLKRGISQQRYDANIQEIQIRLEDRGIRSIVFSAYSPLNRSVLPGLRLSDGHPSEKGHALIAQDLLPRIYGQIGALRAKHCSR